ncbi:MAG: SMP-30/gluconolactonase/LRE family protein [Williamsia sp.]|nr:SMP-30/gluconolactonase/LRE family protein [Williamsia sp.]
MFLALALSFLLSCNKHDAVKINQELYTIPGNTFFPEGIAFSSRAGAFFSGSTTNGDVVRVNVETGAASVFASGAQQARTDCRGMKVDLKDRLWICGGEENKVHVLDPKGALIQTWDLKALYNSGFINDCAADDQYIYFTDSRIQKVYRAAISGSQPGNVEEWLNFTNQQILYGTGFNANGIVLTPDGKYIIIVISNTGKLYRIDRSSKAIIEIIINTPVTAGDGLWITGETLYVSRNTTNKIFPVKLSDSYSKGTVGAEFGDNLLFNTTIARAGNYFLVVNSQLNKRPSATNPTPPAVQLPFTVSRVAIP